MRCPHHQQVCETVRIKSIELAVCPECSGVWLTSSDLQKLVRYASAPKAFAVEADLARFESECTGETVPADFWQEDDIRCSVDGTPMRKHYFAGTTVGLDQCPLCRRFWLDGAELGAVARAVAPNAYEEALGAFILDEVTYPKLEKTLDNQWPVWEMMRNPQQTLWTLGQFALGFYLRK